MLSDHEFVPQTFGSAFCGICRQRFDAPQHNYIFPAHDTPQSEQSAAEDLLEYMDYDIAVDRQLAAEVFEDAE